MSKLSAITRADRYACVDGCPCGWESGKGGQSLPSLSGAARKAAPYTIYCRCDGQIRKVAHKADYTGLVPKWCPRLEENGGKKA